MGRLTNRQRNFDVTVFLPADMESTEAVDRQVKDPFTGEIHAPGLKVKQDGSVEYVDPRPES